MIYPDPHRRRRGFTLLELSVVLVIIALVTSMAVSSGINIISASRQAATTKKMKVIDDAIMAFRIKNNRMPCPGDLTLTQGSANYGSEAPAIGNTKCLYNNAPFVNTYGNYSATGAVPTATLGIPSDFMYDGWGNHFRYTVDATMTQPNAFSLFPVGAVACYANAPKPFTPVVVDRSGNVRSQEPLYVLVSHGPNGHGGYTRGGVIVNAKSVNTAELANCNCSSTATTGFAPEVIVQNPPFYDSGNALDNFDDIVTFKDRWQMKIPGERISTQCPFAYIAEPCLGRVDRMDNHGTIISTVTLNGLSAGANAMEVDANGNMWTLVTATSVMKYPPAGGNATVSLPVGYYFGSPIPIGNLYYVTGLGMDKYGNIWVADEMQSRINRYDTNGNFLSTFPPSCYKSGCGLSSGSGPGFFYQLTGVSIDQQGNFWMADAGHQRMQEFSPTGAYIQMISGVFDYGGTYSAIDHQGNIWVMNHLGFYPLKFNSVGTYLTQLSAASSSLNNFAIDPLNNVWGVTATAYNGYASKNAVSIYNSSGTLLDTFTSGISCPSAIAFAP